VNVILSRGERKPRKPQTFTIHPTGWHEYSPYLDLDHPHWTVTVVRLAGQWYLRRGTLWYDQRLDLFVEGTWEDHVNPSRYAFDTRKDALNAAQMAADSHPAFMKMTFVDYVQAHWFLLPPKRERVA
jgi:hypothetical protein